MPAMTENEDETRMTITGGCRCGAVRYAIEAEPLFARHCWCRDCQYIGAGSGTVNVFFASEKVAVEGALTDYTSHADSGTLMHRQFCAICGTHRCSRKPKRASTLSACAPARWTSPISASRKSQSGPRARRTGPASTPTQSAARGERRPSTYCSIATKPLSLPSRHMMAVQKKTNGAALARGSGVYANAIPPNVCLLTAAEFPAFR
jgi:hypothetical protein